MNTQLPPLVKSLSCDDIDEFADRLKSFHWSVEHRQIERGVFGGDLLIAHLAGMQLARTAYHRGIRSLGNSPAGMIVIAISLSVPPLLHWHGHSVSNDAVILQRSTHGVDLVRKGTFSLGLVAIELDDLLKVAHQTNQSSLESLLLGEKYVIYPTLKALKRFSSHLNTLFTLIQRQAQSLDNLQHSAIGVKEDKRIEKKGNNGQSSLLRPERQTLIRQKTTFLVLDLFNGGQNSHIPNSFSRYQLMKQAEATMLENLNQPFTLYDLCTQLHVSERTLYYGFQEYFGISPMAYFKVLRLNRVHRQLKFARGTETTVTDVATRCGFWHMGQFSQDYKKMFDESPSETLRKS